MAIQIRGITDKEWDDFLDWLAKQVLSDQEKHDLLAFTAKWTGITPRTEDYYRAGLVPP